MKVRNKQMDESTVSSIMIFEDMDNKFFLTIWNGNKKSDLTITKEQAEQIKKDLGIIINYIPF